MREARRAMTMKSVSLPVCSAPVVLILAGLAAAMTPAPAAAQSPLVSVDYTPDALRLPDWFLDHRVTLHTRLSLAWLDRDAFDDAERHFASVGVVNYTRHIKTSNEGAWWPSSVGIQAPPTVGRDVASEILDRAAEYDLNCIVYHRHMEDAYMAARYPDWVCVDSDGTTLSTARGDYMCLNSPYVDYFTTRALELVDRGARGFYLDEKHMPFEGCWCGYCRARFTAETGLTHPTSKDWADPAYRRLVQFNNETIERGIGRYIAAVHERAPNLPLLTSVTYLPNFWRPYMTSNLCRITPSPKNEYTHAVNSGTNQYFRDVATVDYPAFHHQLASGWAFLRDAAQGRPPHIWVNDSLSAEERLSAAAGLMTYGHICNLDMKEATIPDYTFSPAYRLGERVSPFLARRLPARWAAIHFSERRRNELFDPADTSPIYEEILLPMWEAHLGLLERRAPVGYVTDTQLEENELGGYEVLILPTTNSVTAAEWTNIDAFAADGGTVIQLPADPRWSASEATQAEIRAEFVADLLARAGEPPVSMTGGAANVHAVAYVAPGDDERVVVCVPNAFDWLWLVRRFNRSGPTPPKEPIAPPAPVADAVVYLEGPVPARVTEVVSGQELTATPAGAGVEIALPSFDFMACLVVDYTDRGPIEFPEAPVVYVDASAAPGGDGSDWGNAFRTVGEGMATADFDGEVWVAAGEYRESLDMRYAVSIYGGFAGDESERSERDVSDNETILATYATTPVVNFENTGYARLDGFTIRGAVGDGAYGVGFLDGYDETCVLANCVVEGNARIDAGVGGGVYVTEGDAIPPTPARIENCAIRGNYARNGGGVGVYLGGKAILENCRLTGNTALFHGGGACHRAGRNASLLRLINCVIAGNTAQYGGGVAGYDSLRTRLMNCTVTGNAITGGGSGGGVRFGETMGETDIVNTILAFNDSNGFLDASTSDDVLALENCLFFGNGEAAARWSDGGVYNDRDTESQINALPFAGGCVVGDPRFLDAAAGDWRLAPGSAAIDVGRTTGSPSGDIDGRGRPFGTGVDIGAHEYVYRPSDGSAVNGWLRY